MLYNEYKYDDNGEIVLLAMIYTVHGNIERDIIDKESAGHSSGYKLSVMASLPYFLVRYFPEEDFGYWSFNVWPVGPHAKKIMTRPMNMSENRYFWFLERLHNKKTIEKSFSDQLPPKDYSW